jgi:hypothetical protein
MINKFKNLTYEGIFKSLSKMLFFQYIQYPLIFIGLGYIVMKKFPNNELVMGIRNAGMELNNEVVSKLIVIPNEVGAYMVFIILAYGYGFLSLFIQARSFKSAILTPIVFIVKVVAVGSGMVYVFYGFVIQSAMMILVGFVLGVLFIIKQIRKKLNNSNYLIDDDSEDFVDIPEQIHYKR